MKACTEYEGEQLSDVLGLAIAQYAFEIDMPIEEVMDRLVPEPVEFLVSGCIPPVVVELAVSELGQLGKYIGDVFKYDIEEYDFDE